MECIPLGGVYTSYACPSDLTDGVRSSGQGAHIVCTHQIRLAGCVPLRVMRTSYARTSDPTGGVRTSYARTSDLTGRVRTSYARISDLTGRARHSEQGAHIVCTHISSDRHGASIWEGCAQAQLARLHAIFRNVAVLRSCGSPAAQAALMPNALRSATALAELFCGCAMPAV